jgi:CheY-like chemotaxis protein
MDDIKNKTVLIVDDEPDIRLFLKTVLEDAGFNVMTANNGKHALERIKECKPDLISLDLVMPKMGGGKTSLISPKESGMGKDSLYCCYCSCP